MGTRIVAIVMVQVHNGRFMNWNGNQKGQGFEYHLLAIAIAPALLMEASGAHCPECQKFLKCVSSTPWRMAEPLPPALALEGAQSGCAILNSWRMGQTRSR
jgi:hypothetical protein